MYVPNLMTLQIDRLEIVSYIWQHTSNVIYSMYDFLFGTWGVTMLFHTSKCKVYTYIIMAIRKVHYYREFNRTSCDSIQLFNGCGCNRPNYLSWGAGNDQVFYCMRPTLCVLFFLNIIILIFNENWNVWIFLKFLKFWIFLNF